MAKKDPFEEDDGDDKAADKKAIDSIKEKVAERQEAAPEGDLEIDLDKAEDELEDKEPERESRSQRRQNRFREAQDGKAAAERRAEDAERRERETRELVMQMQRAQQPGPAQQPAKEDPLDEELGNAFREQDMLYRDYNARAASLSAQEQEEFARKVRELQRKIVVAGGKIALRDSGLQQGGSERQIRAAVTAQRLQEEAGDVLGDERKRMYMDGAWRQLIASGRKDDWSTINDAAEATRRKFGMPTKAGRAAPSDSYKRKLSGAARGAGGGPSEPRVVVMNEAYKSMADASFRHIKDPRERYKRWAAGPGAKMLEKGR